MPSHSHTATQARHDHIDRWLENPVNNNNTVGYSGITGTLGNNPAQKTYKAQPAITVDPTGSGQSFSNMPPYYTVSYIMKY
jgi:microcystin-dependent protein